jgi:predicted AAA+ superfamily ATPase
MSNITIKDIYAGMPDAKDEINTDQSNNFFASFIIPPGLSSDDLLNGKKYFITGYKGVGKTAVLYYLQNEVHNRDHSACTSFIYFKNDYEEVRRSTLEAIGRKLTAVFDTQGEIQLNKIEYLHVWRWAFFKK